MGKKDKNRKTKNEELENKKEDVIPSKIDFSKDYEGIQNHICVKVKNKKENFCIFTGDYVKSLQIKEHIAKIKNLSVENIKLYYNNSRLIEDETMNYDQQIKHNTILYACFKNNKDEWENIKEIIN